MSQISKVYIETWDLLTDPVDTSAFRSHGKFVACEPGPGAKIAINET